MAGEGVVKEDWVGSLEERERRREGKWEGIFSTMDWRREVADMSQVVQYCT